MTKKSKRIRSAVLYFSLLQLFFVKPYFAQDTDKLHIGDKAPGMVLSSTNNSIQSFSFPYQNKMTFVFFWSSSVPKSTKNIYKYKKLFDKYADIGYKDCDGFNMISVAVQSDKSTWNQDLIKYDLSKISNCIAQRGLLDLFVTRYKITETPATFLIDEFGKIAAIDPDIKTLIAYLDQKRNVELSTDVQTKLTGKIKYGNDQLAPLANHTLFFLNEKRDTVKSVVLDEKGSFIVKDINTMESLHLYLFPTPKINNEQAVFLTSENGEIISPFAENNNNSHEYDLLDVEMPYLKPLFDNEASVKQPVDKSIKHLYICETLFTLKETVLSKESMLKLNQIIITLKQNPKTHLEVISHTDSNGDPASNLSVTIKQSNNIVAYLVSKGIAKTRLKSLGKGETEILNTCKDGVDCSDAEHNKNRRTEFKFYPSQ